MPPPRPTEDAHPLLPPELLINIVQASLSPDSPRENAATLARYCRVSTNVRSIALRHLYSELYLLNDRNAAAFVRGVAGSELCGLVESVRFVGVGEKPEVTREVLRLLPSVKEVILEDSRLTYLAGFEYCAAPTLHLDGVRQSFPHASLHPPILGSATFGSLRRLVLYDIGVFLLFDLLCLSTASFPGLTELACFDAYEEDEYLLESEFEHLIPTSLAPQLRHLLLHAGPSDRLPSFIRPFLAAATSLVALSFSDLNKSLEKVYAKFLPESISKLTLRSDCRSDPEDGSNLSFAREALERLPNLARLELWDGKLEVDLAKLEEECGRRGVLLVTPKERDVWPPGLHWMDQRRVFNYDRLREFDELVRGQDQMRAVGVRLTRKIKARSDLRY